MPPLILYVEDNPANRMLIRRLLSAAGYDLLEAEDAQAMRRLLETARPDLILMDLHLPGVDGFTLIQELRSRPEFQQVPIIALTADVLRDTPAKCYEAGCDGYIPKPIDVDRFLETIEAFLKQSQT